MDLEIRLEFLVLTLSYFRKRLRSILLYSAVFMSGPQRHRLALKWRSINLELITVAITTEPDHTCLTVFQSVSDDQFDLNC